MMMMKQKHEENPVKKEEKEKETSSTSCEEYSRCGEYAGSPIQRSPIVEECGMEQEDDDGVMISPLEIVNDGSSSMNLINNRSSMSLSSPSHKQSEKSPSYSPNEGNNFQWSPSSLNIDDNDNINMNKNDNNNKQCKEFIYDESPLTKRQNNNNNNNNDNNTNELISRLTQ